MILTNFNELLSYAINRKLRADQTLLKVNDTLVYEVNSVIHFNHLKNITVDIKLENSDAIAKIFSNYVSMQKELEGYHLSRHILNVAKLNYFSKETDDLYMVIYEKLPGLNLLHYFRTKSYDCSYKHCQQFILKLYDAFQAGILQLDMSPGNFFITTKDECFYLDYSSFKKVRFKSTVRFIRSLAKLFIYFLPEENGAKLMDECVNDFLSGQGVTRFKFIYKATLRYFLWLQEIKRQKYKLKCQNILTKYQQTYI